jgi:DNA (cytosine-5)-methyltransferase 1
MRHMTFGSLFAGIGGFDLGLERAGMVCKWQVEIDEYAGRVLAKNFPSVERWGDVRTFPPGLPDEYRVDVICAGVPCQPVSHAGKQKGVEDERWMWGEALRVVADLGPRFFVAENPIGILNHDGGRTFRGLLRALASVGYVCEWHVIAAADVGAPHKRDRVWLVAYADSVSCTEGQPRRADRGLPAESAGSQGREDKGKAWAVAGGSGEDVADADQLRRKGGDKPEALQGVGEARSEPAGSGEPSRKRGSSVSAAEGFGDCLRRQLQTASGMQGLHGAARLYWATEPELGRVADGVPARVDRLRCLGNAVVPQIVEIIGRAIIEWEGCLK